MEAYLWTEVCADPDIADFDTVVYQFSAEKRRVRVGQGAAEEEACVREVDEGKEGCKKC